jgi:hypothetical protein
MKNRVLVITGMHRSGTSLITQWLYKCGLNVGDQLEGPGIGNEDGHFEDADFYNCHQDILGQQGFPVNGLIHTPLTSLSKGQLQTLHDLVQVKANKRPQWGWKEPRTCLFLDFYRPLLPTACYLVILRDYQSVVSSLISRLYKESVRKYERKGGIPLFIWKHFKEPYRKVKLLRKYSTYYLKVWMTYNENILRHLEKVPPSSYLVVYHSSLGDKNQAIFDHLSGQWDFQLQYLDFNTIYKARLISEVLEVEKYVRDKDLLRRANDIQQKLLALTV